MNPSSPKELSELFARDTHYTKLQNEEGSHSPVILEFLAIDVGAIPAEFSQADLLPGSSSLPRILWQDWAVEQLNDPLISRVIDIVLTLEHI